MFQHAQALIWRFEAYAELPDLELAVTLATQAVSTVTADPMRARARTVLAHALRLRFQATGDLADIDESVRVAREGSDPAALGSSELTAALSQLDVALLFRFRQTAVPDDLSDAERYARRVLELAGPDHPERSIFLSTLVAALRTRFDSGGHGQAALAEIVELAEGAVRRTADVVPLRNLALGLFARYRGNGAATDLDEAVRSCREAVARISPGDVRSGTFHAHLAFLLQESGDHAEATVSLLSGLYGGRYRLHGAPADLAEATRLGHKALEAAPPGRRDRAVILNNLVTVLNMSEDDAAGVLAVELARESAAQANPNPESLPVLSAVLVRRARETGDESLWAEAGVALRTTSESTTAPADARVTAAVAWASLAIEREDWAMATLASQTCTRLLPLLAWRGLSRQDQERRLVDGESMARVGAACALSAGRPEEAVEILEQGRGVLLAQALDIRTDAADLVLADPELARRLEETRRSLDALTVTLPPGDADASREADRRQRLASRWDELDLPAPGPEDASAREAYAAFPGGYGHVADGLYICPGGTCPREVPRGPSMSIPYCGVHGLDMELSPTLGPGS